MNAKRAPRFPQACPPAALALAAATLLAAAAVVSGCCGTKTPPPAKQPATASATAAAGATASPTAAATPAPRTPPATEEACKACNGAWAQHGISQTFSCNCRTSDGGKKCSDGSDCQGMCITADTPERDVIEPGPHPRGYFVGRCSATSVVYGCNRIIDRGAATHGPIDLAEPPQQICVD